MKNYPNNRANDFALKLLKAAMIALLMIGVHLANAADLSGNYTWKPVRIGGGGWVVGMTIHPLNPNVRYCRTDVGNCYRWDNTAGEWFPMRVYNHSDNSGLPAAVANNPSAGGEQSIAVDPKNLNTVYVALNGGEDGNEGFPSFNVNVYKSVDGGKNFTAGNLSVPGNSNDDWRYRGERLVVDPNNSNVLYFGTPLRNGSGTTGSGLYRSLDGGATWTQVSTGGAPSTTANVLNVLFYKGGGTTNAQGLTGISNVIAAVVGDGDVFLSKDGGVTWTNISSGIGISGQAAMTTIDPSGNLWVAQDGSKNAWKYAYASGTWSSVSIESGNGNPLRNVTADPTDATGKRYWAISQDGSSAYSTDGGVTWTALGRYLYANTLGWLPQQVGNAAAYGYRSTGGAYFDSTGTVWSCQGQEGILYYKPTFHETSQPSWTITTTGIEELVSQDIYIPKGSGDHILVAAEDTTGFELDNPDSFSSIQINLQSNLISQGTNITTAPDDPTFAAVTTSDVYDYGANQSGYSTDGGKTWTQFHNILQFQSGGNKIDSPTGLIAVSPRKGGLGLGHDNIVMVPINDFVPQYSTDGGTTWAATTSFPTESGNPLVVDGSQGYQGMFNLSLKEHELVADPFVKNKFYYKWVQSPASLYVSVDGGKTWTVSAASGQLPNYTYFGWLVANSLVQNDLWFASGWACLDSNKGLSHSTDGGQTFTQVAGVDYATLVAIGAGSGKSGDAPYTVYFYGRVTGDTNWGVFRSTNAGASWDRVSYYPYGIFDEATCMSASYDTFGKVYVGFNGNSFVYGTQGTSSNTPLISASQATITPTTTVSSGAAIKISSTFTNTGSVLTNGQLGFVLSSGSAVVKQKTFTGVTLAQNGTKTESWSINAPTTAGTYSVFASASNTNGSTSYLYTQIGTLTVVSNTTPPSFTISTKITPSTTVGPGGVITIATTFTDTGGPLTNGQLGFRLNDSSNNYVDGYTLSGVNIAAGGSKTITWAKTMPTTTGAYNLYCAAWNSDYSQTYLFAGLGTLNVVGPTVNNGYYSITNLGSGFAIDTKGATAPKSALQQYTVKPLGSEDWSFTFANGFYTIENLASGLYIADSKTGTANSTLVQNSADGQYDQLWSVTPSNGHYVITNAVDGFSIDNGGSTTSGTAVVTNTTSSSNAQSWNLNSVSVAPKPAAPTNLKAVAQATGSKTIGLSWNSSAGATDYRIYRATTGTYTLVRTTSSVSFTDKNLTAGTAYSYKVSAINTGGESALAGPVTATAR